MNDKLKIPLPQFPLWVAAASAGGLFPPSFLLPRLSRAVLPQTMCRLREGQDQSQRHNLQSAALSSRAAEMACFVPVSGAGWTITTTCKVDARSAHSTGLKTRSVTGRAPLNLVGGYRFPNAIEIEADLAGYIRAIEACLLGDEPVELPTVESPPLISPDPFDIPPSLTAYRMRRPGSPPASSALMLAFRVDTTATGKAREGSG